MNDEYLDAVLIYFCAVCERCGTLRDHDSPTPIVPRHPEEGWDKALADAIRSEGWHVEYNQSRDTMFCPNCAKLPHDTSDAPPQ